MVFILTFKGINIISFEGDPVNAVQTAFMVNHTAESHKQSESSFPSFHRTESYVQISKLNLSHLQGNVKKIARFFY